jgi:hypothetical protein
VPQSGVPFRSYFAFRSDNGQICEGWTTPSGYISKDGNSFLKASDVPHEIATNTGCGYLDLTAAEMSCRALLLKMWTYNTSPSSIPLVLTFYPEQVGDYRISNTDIFRANVIQVSGIYISPVQVADVNVVQVSGDYVSLADFGGGATIVGGVIDANVVSISGVPVNIDANSVADSDELSVLGNLLLRNARIIRLLP